jgi:hypothetical protein
MMKILDMVGTQAEGEPPEMDEQPAAVTEPNTGVPAGARGKVMEYLKGKGMDEASCKEVMDMMPEDMGADDEETEEEKKAREEKERVAAKDKEPPTVSKTAMDAAIGQARKDATADTMKRLNDIRAAERAVHPLIGDITVAMDSADAIYLRALKAHDIQTEGVHPSAFPAMVALLTKQKAEYRPALNIANDAALVTDRAAFDKEFGIAPSHIRHLGA